MTLDAFNTAYTPLMMEVVKRYADLQQQIILNTVRDGNHYELLEARWKIESLAEARMLLEVYESVIYPNEPETNGHS